LPFYRTPVMLIGFIRNSMTIEPCDHENFTAMQKNLQELKIEAESAEFRKFPNNTTAFDIDSAKKVLKLIEALENYVDVQNVFHKMEMIR